jgi:hypothetical protein
MSLPGVRAEDGRPAASFWRGHPSTHGGSLAPSRLSDSVSGRERDNDRPPPHRTLTIEDSLRRTTVRGSPRDRSRARSHLKAWDRAAARRAGWKEPTAPPRRRSFEAIKASPAKRSTVLPAGQAETTPHPPAHAGEGRRILKHERDPLTRLHPHGGVPSEHAASDDP